MATLPEQTRKFMSASTSIPWKTCACCVKTFVFKTPADYCKHLKAYHCKKEGGSYVCHYGPYGVCPSLPVDGVSDQDYDDHVARDHVRADGGRVGRSSARGRVVSTDAVPGVMFLPVSA